MHHCVRRDKDCEPFLLKSLKKSFAFAPNKLLKSDWSISLTLLDVWGTVKTVDNASRNPCNPFPPSLNAWDSCCPHWAKLL